MEMHEKFRFSEMREAIFGYVPQYSDKFDLAIYLRRLVILSAAFLRAYYRKKKNDKVNMTSRMLDKVVNRPYLSLDNCISILTGFQSNREEIEELGLDLVSVYDDASSPEYINLYEVKAIVNDKTGLFNAKQCLSVLEKAFNCLSFLADVDIKSENGIFFVYNGEEYDVGDLFKFEFTYLYLTVKDVDPLETEYIAL